MAITTSANNASLSPLSVYYDKVLLPRLIAKTVYHNLAFKKGLPDGNGRTYSWIVGGVQPTNTTPLVEGVPVTAGPTTSATITAQVQEYGNVFAASSLLANSSVVDAFKYLMEQVEQAGAYAVDALLRNEVYNAAQTTFGVNQFACNQKGSIAAITSSDTMTLADVRFAHFFLEQNNVKTKGNGKYVGVVSTGQKYDLTNQSADGGGGFLDLAKRNASGIAEIKKSVEFPEDGNVDVIGEYAGMVLFSTSLNPVVSNGTVNVHYSAFWGDASLASVELDGEQFKIFTKQADKGTYDVIEMIKMAAGYKMAFAAKNLSEDYTSIAKQRVVQMAGASSLF
jgi:N4-gp56 family major capsid protein